MHVRQSFQHQVLVRAPYSGTICSSLLLQKQCLHGTLPDIAESLTDSVSGWKLASPTDNYYHKFADTAALFGLEAVFYQVSVPECRPESRTVGENSHKKYNMNTSREGNIT